MASHASLSLPLAGFNFRDPNDLFSSFFGTSNPFAGVGGAAGGLGGLGGMGGGAPPPIRVALQCTLEELATGCTKRAKVTRKRGGVDSEKVLEIVVKPGWRAGTSVTFEHEGDEVPGGGRPADVQFVIEERPHERFQRDRNDLVMDRRLTLGEALCGTRLEVRTLDGRVLSLAIPEVITPGYVKRVAGEGMPVKGGSGRGDLVLRFEVVFPGFVAEGKKAQLRALLA